MDVGDTKTWAYYVPSMSIWLFSPQVYIGTNPIASLTLDYTRVSLRLAFGASLQFPLNNCSQLPFMLNIVQSTNTNGMEPHRHSLDSHPFSSQMLPSKISSFSLIASPTQPLLPEVSLPRITSTFILTSRSFFCGIANMDRLIITTSKPFLVNHIKPKDPSAHGESLPWLVTPTRKGASSCKVPCCKACQCAKQQHITPWNTKHPSDEYKRDIIPKPLQFRRQSVLQSTHVIYTWLPGPYLWRGSQV